MKHEPYAMPYPDGELTPAGEAWVERILSELGVPKPKPPPAHAPVKAPKKDQPKFRNFEGDF